MRVIGTESAAAGTVTSSAGTGSGGFKKGGFKSSFSSVKAAAPAPVKRNVLGDEEDDERMEVDKDRKQDKDQETVEKLGTDESDTDEEEYPPGSYYDPRRPTECSATCSGRL